MEDIIDIFDMIEDVEDSIIIILTKVEELDALISRHAKNRHARDTMSHKLNAIRMTARSVSKMLAV